MRLITLGSFMFGLLITAGPDLRGQSRTQRDVPETMRSILNLRLNRDSAASLVAKLGQSQSWVSGSGHDKDLNWCYRGSMGVDDVTVHFQSDASDMGSDNGALNVIRLIAGAHDSVDRNPCSRANTALPRGLGGIVLGGSEAEVIRHLGTPSRRMTDTLTYHVDSTELLDPKSPYFAHWNTLERRRSCFEGKAPYVNVGGRILIVLRQTRVSEILVARYDNAIC